LKAIEGAKSHIYIENQFFISSTAGNGVVNGIAKAIIKYVMHRCGLMHTVWRWY
jgi:phosphatidylserine/phosphatidylglycerophosphate/cardiolipin synthase-like enzyme